MIISKVLNNNVVIVTRENSEEVIVMGRGLAFGKKVGDEINDALIEKVFTLDNNENNKFQQYLSDLDLQYFDFCQQLINYAKEQLAKTLSNSLYITLTDHINTIVERAKVGSYLNNTMLWDLKRLYPDEFKVSLEIVNKINEKFASRFDENEAANITLHLVNAEINGNLESIYDITKLMSEILNIVKYYFKIQFNEESLGYYRFITHLKFFAQRIFSLSTYDSKDDKELLELIQTKYPEIYDCTRVIRNYLTNQYHYTLDDDECLYLTLHIAKVVRESTKL